MSFINKLLNSALQNNFNVSPLYKEAVSRNASFQTLFVLNESVFKYNMTSSILSQNLALRDKFNTKSFVHRCLVLSGLRKKLRDTHLPISVGYINGMMEVFQYPQLGAIVCNMAIAIAGESIGYDAFGVAYNTLMEVNRKWIKEDHELDRLNDHDLSEWGNSSFDAYSGASSAVCGISPMMSGILGLGASMVAGYCIPKLHERWKRFYEDSKVNNPFIRGLLALLGGAKESCTNLFPDMTFVAPDKRGYTPIFSTVKWNFRYACGFFATFVVTCFNTGVVQCIKDSTYLIPLYVVFGAPVVEEVFKVIVGNDSEFAMFEFITSLALPWRITPFWMHFNLPNRKIGGKKLNLFERILWHMGFNGIQTVGTFIQLTLTASSYMSWYFSTYCYFVALAIVFEERYSDKKRSGWIKFTLATIFLLLGRSCGILLFPGQFAHHVTNIVKNLNFTNLPSLLAELNIAILYSYANCSHGFFLGKVSDKEYEVCFAGEMLAAPSLSSEEIQYPTPFFVPLGSIIHVRWFYVDDDGITIEDKALHWYVSGAAWNKLMHDLFGNIDSEIVDSFSLRHPQFNATFGLNPSAKEFVPKSYARQYITTVAQFKSILADCETSDQIDNLGKQYVIELDDYTIEREKKGRLRSIAQRKHYHNPSALSEEGMSRQADLSKFIALSHGKHRESKGYRAPVFDHKAEHRKYRDDIHFYKVPLLPVPGDVVPKPTVSQAKMNPMLVKYWISSIGHRCKPKDSFNPRKAVCGNEACRILMVTPSYGNYSAKDLQHLLDTCVLSYVDMKEKPPSAPTKPTLSDFITNKPVERKFINENLVCRTAKDMQMIFPMFKRDKPLFRAMVDYLENGTIKEGETLGHLNSEFVRITSKVMTIKQGDELTLPLEDGDSFIASEIFEGLKVIKESGFLSLSRFVSMVFGVYRAATAVERINIFFLYLTTVDCEKIPEDVVGTFTNLFKAHVSKQGEPTFSTMKETFSYEALFDIFSSLSVWNLLEPFQYSDWGIVRYIVRTIKFIMSKSRFKEGETLVQKVLRFILEGLKRFKMFLETKDWNVFFVPYDTYPSWTKRCDGLLDHTANVVADRGLGGDSSKEFTRLRKNKLIPECWVQPFTEQEFENELIRCIHLGEEFLKIYRGTDNERSIAIYLQRLKTYKSQSNAAHNVMANRVQPLGISLVGEAGVGKTNITDMIIKSIARKHDFPYSSEYVHRLQLNSNFQDGANSTQWAWVGDDIDQNPAPAVAGMENHCTWVVKIVNNSAFPIESAAVEMKGKVCARPLVYISTTNFDRPRLQGYILYPPAYYRRLGIRIRVVPKPEFLHGTNLDVEKAKESNTPDMWNFYVSVYDSKKYDKNNPFSSYPYSPVDLEGRTKYLAHLQRKTYQEEVKDFLETPMNISELLIFINEEFDRHLQAQKERIARAQGDGEWCPTCGLDLSQDQFCPCLPLVTVEQQGLKLLSKGIGIIHSLVVSERASLGITTIVILSAGLAAKFSIDYASRLLFKCVKDKTDEIESIVKEAFADVVEAKTKVVNTATSTFNFLNVAAKIGATIGVAIQAVKLIRELYVRYYLKQGLSDNRTEKVQLQYVRADQQFDPAAVRKSTWTKEELLETVVNSLFSVYNKTTTMRMNAFWLAHDCFLVPKHLAVLGDCLEFSRGNLVLPVVVSDFNMCSDPNSDVMLIRCSHATGLRQNVMSKIWSDIDFAVVNFDEAILVLPSGLVPAKNPRRITLDGEHCLRVDPCTVEGDCGGVYVARMNNSWFIVAIHTGMATAPFTGNHSLGHIVSANQLKAMGTRVQTTLQGVYCPVEQFPKKVEVVPCPPKRSEVAAAILQRGASVGLFGTVAPKIVGCSMKSKVHPTIFCDEFADLEEKWCGRKDYWQIPDFSGKMENDKWNSWFVNSLGALERKTPDECYLMLAVLDYLQPFLATRREGYRELSDNEVIVGIPGSVINSANLSTSTGLPFSSKKRGYMYVVDKEAFVHPEFVKVWDAYKSVSEDDLSVGVSVCTQKDEPIKYSKNEARTGRVFNVLSAAYNFKMKKKSSPVKAYTRANWRLAESAVGINVGSSDMIDVKMHLASVNPALDKVEEADYEKIDKKTSGIMFHYCGIAFSGLAWLIGTDWQGLRSCVYSARHTVYIINNDMYQIGGENSSGLDMTVEVNSMNNSIANRYVHFRRTRVLDPEERRILIDIFCRAISDPSSLFHHDITGLDFRLHYALMTYGDDMLKSHGEFGSLDNEEEYFLELGYVMTDGQKEKGLKYRSWEEVTFLKRRFYTHSSGLMFCPLEKKTLAKMLRMSNDSTLSRYDHGAQLLTDCLRECVYHGEEFYQEMKKRFEKVVEKYGLEGNPYVVFKSFEERLQEIKDKTFTTWTPAEKELFIV